MKSCHILFWFVPDSTEVRTSSVLVLVALCQTLKIPPDTRCKNFHHLMSEASRYPHTHTHIRSSVLWAHNDQLLLANSSSRWHQLVVSTVTFLLPRRCLPIGRRLGRQLWRHRQSVVWLCCLLHLCFLFPSFSFFVALHFKLYSIFSSLSISLSLLSFFEFITLF